MISKGKGRGKGMENSSKEIIRTDTITYTRRKKAINQIFRLHAKIDEKCNSQIESISKSKGISKAKVIREAIQVYYDKISKDE